MKLAFAELFVGGLVLSILDRPCQTLGQEIPPARRNRHPGHQCRAAFAFESARLAPKVPYCHQALRDHLLFLVKVRVVCALSLQLVIALGVCHIFESVA
ncbi:MAG TPA: hypothetical protein VMU32_06640 [Solirubrobacteraceae bacterium]|nr:hypothetical protein [Solirubrobacteraceae bacterium]